MRVQRVLLTILGLQAVIAVETSSIPATVVNRYITRLNKVRYKQGGNAMCQVTWDEALATELVDFSVAQNNSFFFDNVNLPGPAGRGNSSWNGFHVMQMKPFNLTFPTYNFLYHDTFVSPDRFLFNLRFRLGQIHCINWEKCNRANFTNFESCGEPLELEPGLPCSWATQYVPRLMLSSLNSLACVIFKEHGPNAPSSQQWSFFCYGNYSHPVDDVPFVKGSVCKI